MSGEERLSREQWRRVGMSGLFRERRSGEMTKLNNSSPRGSVVPFKLQWEGWQLKSPD